mgnify:CR=1 FL=1
MFAIENEILGTIIFFKVSTRNYMELIDQIQIDEVDGKMISINKEHGLRYHRNLV